MNTTFKLKVDLRNKPEREHKALVAKLLRLAAQKVEEGKQFSGWKEDGTKGGFTFQGDE